MQRRTVTSLALVGVVALIVAACGGSGSHNSGTPTTASGSAGTNTTANVTVDVEGNTLSGPIAGGLNPFLTNEDAYNLGAVGMIYEPLLQFNILKPGVTRPWLATSATWTDGGKTLTFDLRNDVKWSNGTPFTSDDVVYTLDLVKANAALNAFGINFTSVTNPSPTKVVMTFAQPGYSQLYSIAGLTLMVPKALWSSVSNPGTYPDTNPVGTGPYELKSLSPESITLTKNPNYWQAGKPAVSTLVFPDYESNTTATSALESGQLTWGGNFISHIQQIFANTAQHVFYSPPDNTVSLWPNLRQWPTNNLAVREAISLALDRGQIAQQGEEGDEAPASTNTGLIVPNDQQYLTSSTNTLPHDLNRAAQVMQQAGFTLKNGVWTSSSGQQVTISLEDPASYSDYMASDQAIAQQLTSFGIKTSVDGVAVNAWNSDLASGHFGMSLRWGQTSATPYAQYDNWLDPSLIGGSQGNFEGFNNPTASAALQAYAGAGNNGGVQSAINTLGQVVATQLPIIPVMYGASWGEYNASKVTGFPSATNQYDPAQPAVPWDEYVVLQLHPVS
jgi:peptide/nickel transport system substrate-binding protein